uniref:Uncharacterized protein n=1 Tax=Leersia perrieri TaxID=77586 RepID=A0A0D9X4X6_9ORYZ
MAECSSHRQRIDIGSEEYVHLAMYRAEEQIVDSIWQHTNSSHIWHQQIGRPSGCWFHRKAWTCTPQQWPWPLRQIP